MLALHFQENYSTKYQFSFYFYKFTKIFRRPVITIQYLHDFSIPIHQPHHLH